MDYLHERLERLEQQTPMVAGQLRWWCSLAGPLFALDLRRRRNGRGYQMTRHPHGRHSLWAMGMVVVWITSAVGQTINCGDTLGPGGVFQLQADLDCGEESPALTVRDGAVLDLGGHTITSSGVTILLEGQKAGLQNGTVRSGDIGVSLEGGGRHIVRGVEVAFPHLEGFAVSSDHNRLLKNRATSDGAGFRIIGRHNLLANNIGDGQVGFEVNGDANLLFKNSHTPGGVFSGFNIEGDHNLLVSNEALDGETQGFRIAGNGNTAVGNVATGYVQEGIRVAGQKNVMIRNTALDNHDIDLVDTHEDCDGNVWHQNVFQTSQAGSSANPACIR